MRFHFERVDPLPRLAWHARLRMGSDEVEVTHGPWVETRPDAFAEGAWDGPFEAFRPDGAVTFTGTGGRAAEREVVFFASSNCLEHLYLSRRDDALHVSNSLACLLVMSGDAPDPRFPYYEDEFMTQAILGVMRGRRSLPAAQGEVTVHECANLSVAPDLAITRREKPAPPPPHSFGEYEALLSGTVERVFANARDPARRHRYEPIASVSTGYDSTCVAALAARHGCKRAITFTEDEPGVPDADDGSAVATALGLSVVGLTRRAPPPRPLGEAEFCVCPPSGDRVWLGGEGELAGRMLLTGRGGDLLLATSPVASHGALARHPQMDLGGATMNEFRLRTGTLQLAPLYAGWQHVESIRAIGRSDALRPWSIGGDYDRPIPRRVLEQAGVAREAFGTHKRGGAYAYVRAPRDLSAESRADYMDFYRELAPPRSLVWRMRLLRRFDRANRRALARLRRLGGPEWGPLLARRYRLPPEAGFLFHWGFARTRERYRAT